MSDLGADIVVVDLETTGFDPAVDRPVEIGWCRLSAPPNLFGVPNWMQVTVGTAASLLLEPQRPIPPESSAIHHLIAADLENAMDWQRGLELFATIAGRVRALAAHSAKFERQWLTAAVLGREVPWICTWKCALRAFPDAPGHGNQVLRYWLAAGWPDFDRARAMPAHRAGPDAYATAFLLREMLLRYQLEELLRWSEEPAVLIRVPFGKRPEDGGNRGRRWSEVEDEFLEWTLVRDFSDDILHTVRLEIERRDRAAPPEAA